jgi:iduronate 2-sulfatase
MRSIDGNSAGWSSQQRFAMKSAPRLHAALLLAPLAALHAADASRPNVLFIVADDFRAELASYGSPAKTPNLDRLARRSLQFDHAYAQQAVCNPSRSSFLTGLRPDTLRIWNNGTHFRELNPDVPTIPLWFKEHGYTARGVGKIFHNWHTKMHGDPQSWSAPEFLHYANHADDDVQVPGAPPPNLATTTGGFGYPKNGICECRDVPDEAYYDGRVAAEAGRVLGELKQHKEPFFLAVGFWKPHAPFNAPKKYWDLYDRARLPPLDERNAPRPLGAPDLAFHGSTEVLGPVKGQKRPTPEQAAEMRHGYFANISYLDAQLGKVLDALEASGVAERTIVIFFSDHGFHVGEHALWGKTSNFELDARVPLFIHAPGMKAASRRTASPTELIDLFPTLVSLCGLPMPAALEGTNLAPLLDAPNHALKPAAFTQHPRPAHYDREPAGQPSAMGVSVRTARVRYTEWREWKTGHVLARELYDALNDPHEMRNAVDVPALAAAQGEAAALLTLQFPITPH